jgi:hypothetical protein
MTNELPKKRVKSTKSKNCHVIPRHEFGMGYFKPNSMPASQFHQTVSEWTDKLAQSGFNDIEMPSYGTPGAVMPYFKSNGDFQVGNLLHDPTSEAYYRLARLWLHDCNWRAKFYGQAALYRFIWSCVSEGVPYRSIVKALAGQPVSKKYSSLIPYIRPRDKRDQSLYWLFCRIRELGKHFAAWRATYVDDPMAD